MPTESRTSPRSRRERERRRISEAQRQSRDAADREAARERIRTRLSEVPESWRRRYHTLLANDGVNPRASLSHISSLDNLRRRVHFLPPKTVYVHMRNRAHPSLPEPRVTKVVVRERFQRATNKRHCDNASAFSPSLLTFPTSPNIARIKPSNLLSLSLPNGHTECVNKNVLRKLHKSGFVLAQSYQRDAHGDHWAEMLVDTHQQGTVRVPLWLLEEATGETWNVPSHRRPPPHETTYA